MITIINYGMGNLGSIQNMFKYLEIESVVAENIDDIARAKKILLPGVGAFDAAVTKVDELGWRGPLLAKALEEKVPFLGICLGMQLLGKKSEEGVLQGLGLINANCKKFPSGSGLRVPHMGWNTVAKMKPSLLTKDLPDESRYYFVHSYYMELADQQDCLLQTSYGLDYTSAVQRDNIYGAQFHPEKSHKFGLQLFKNFAEI